MIKTEGKICIPPYKMAYAVCFVVVLCMVRGIVYSYEIGISLDPAMALLAFVFCADTGTREMSSGRSEIWRLFPLKNRIRALAERMMVQEMVLFGLSAAGYGLYIVIQRPQSYAEAGLYMHSEFRMFLVFLADIAVTLWFWGILSDFLACLFRNMWAGIAGCAVLWIATNSTFGNRYFGMWNLFSYVFRDAENSADFRWLYGKSLCLGICVALSLCMPEIIKKRG